MKAHRRTISNERKYADEGEKMRRLGDINYIVTGINRPSEMGISEEKTVKGERRIQRRI